MQDPIAKKNSHLQDKLIEHVQDELRLSRSYILLLTLSTIIATLGLLIDSVAVVIGAMIISPLFWPIMGIIISVFRAKRRLLKDSVMSLLFSIFLVLVISLIIAWITPIHELTDSIQERMNPTLIDLFIALASSVIGVFAIYYPRISSTAAGVAVSIALLPPISVAGIGIAFGSLEIFWPAFLLFATNIAAMIFAGIVTLYVLHFRPGRKAEERRLRLGFSISIFTLIVLSIPLTIYLRNTLIQNNIQKDVNAVLSSQISSISEEARIDDVVTLYVPTASSEVIVDATVYLPEGIFLTEVNQNDIIDELALAVERTVDLKLNIVNTVLLRRQEDEEIKQLRTDLESTIQKGLSDINPAIAIDSIKINFPETDLSEITLATDPIRVELLIRQTDGMTMSYEQKEQLAVQLEELTVSPIELEVELLPVKRVTQPDESLKLQEKASNVVVQDLAEIDPQASLVNLEINEKPATASQKSNLVVTAQVRLPSTAAFTFDDKKEIQFHLSKELDEVVELSVELTRFEEVILKLEPEPESEENEAAEISAVLDEATE